MSAVTSVPAGRIFSLAEKARAVARGGAIVSIRSRNASYANPGTGHNGAAQAALEELAKTLHTESRVRRQVQTVPLQRLGTPADIGPLCACLVSGAAAWTSGTVIAVNGGSLVPMGHWSGLHNVNAASRAG